MDNENKKNNALEKAINAQRNKEITYSGQSLEENSQKYNEDYRIKKAKEKAQKKEEKRKAKAIRKKERQAQREAKFNYKNAPSRKKPNGLVAGIITLSILTVVFGSALIYTLLMPTDSKNALEEIYRKSFYDAAKQIDNIDNNMSKFLATSDSEAKQNYLVDLAVNSELCESDIQELPLQDENKYYTTKLINQIGDYAKYLNKKLINGEKISEEERNNFYELYTANLTLKQALQNVINSMTVDFNFSSMLSDGNKNIIVSSFSELQNLSVEYPELIYDGPFSDGQDREIKGLSGEQVSLENAQEEFVYLFSDMGLENIKYQGKATTDIESYCFSADVKGESIYAQISLVGAKLVMFSYAGNCNEVVYQSDEAIEKAKEFLSQIGYSDMQEVWVNLANNVYTINFASTVNDIIVYSDLIKVRVCAETNTVIGLEATSYLTNHTERVLSSPTLTKAQASTYVFSEMDINSGRLCLVPVGRETEKLCYEFCGEYDGATFYVYIDAVTGKQVEMFKVIESTEGELLL